MLSDKSRMLGGGFLYTADIMFDGNLVHDMARIFAQKFADRGADYVVTVETKGIALAAQTAFMLHLPLVVIRREARYSEGSTVSINYFSGSTDRIQKMSIAKRAVKPGTRAIVIDDFKGVALGSREPERKKVDDYTPIVIVEEIDEENRKITISANEALQAEVHG